MKRIIVLAIVGLLVASFAMADTTVSAKVEYRAMNDMTDEVFTNAGVVELKFNGTADDFNSLYIELEEGPKTTGYDTGGFGLDKAHLTTDVGGLLALPVGLTVNAGFNEFKVKDGIKVTKGEYEDTLGEGWDNWGYSIELTAQDMVTLRTSFGGDWDIEEFLIGAYGTYDPVTAEIFYAIDTGEAADEGTIEGGAEFGMDVADGMGLGVGLTAGYDQLSEDWNYGLGVDFTYMELARFGLALQGMKDAEAGGLAIYASATPIENLEAFLVVGLALDEAFATAVVPGDEETGLDSIDFGLSYKFGASTWYVGYLYSTDGGKIAKEWAELNPSGEEGAIYIRAKLES